MKEKNLFLIACFLSSFFSFFQGDLIELEDSRQWHLSSQKPAKIDEYRAHGGTRVPRATSPSSTLRRETSAHSCVSCACCRPKRSMESHFPRGSTQHTSPCHGGPVRPDELSERCYSCSGLFPLGGHAHCIIHAAALDGYNYSYSYSWTGRVQIARDAIN